jgi:hypothetical protein
MIFRPPIVSKPGIEAISSSIELKIFMSVSVRGKRMRSVRSKRLCAYCGQPGAKEREHVIVGAREHQVPYLRTVQISAHAW